MNKIKIDGQIYTFQNNNEYKKVKEMDKAERKAYVSNLSEEEELQMLGDDFDDNVGSKVENSQNNNVLGQNANNALMVSAYSQQIQMLQNEKNQLYNSMLMSDSIDDNMAIFEQINDIQDEISDIRTDMLSQLSASSFLSSGSLDNIALSNADTTSVLGADTGSNIVNYAESFLGRKNPSRTVSGNKFVRVQRGGTCDDFATYVIDNSTDKSNLANWYNKLTEKEKAWGPDIFRAAREADATVSLKNARCGDLASIDLNNDGGMDHTVIVKEIKNGKVYTIESNGGSIVNKTYKTSQICNIARVTKE